VLKDLRQILDAIFYTIIICLAPILAVAGLLSIIALAGHYRRAQDPYERKACLWMMMQWNAISFLIISFCVGLFFGVDAIDWYNHFFPHPGWLLQLPMWLFHIDFIDSTAGPTILDWAICGLIFLLTTFWKPFGEVKYIGDVYHYLPPDGYTTCEARAAYQALQASNREWEEKRKRAAQKAAVTRAKNSAARERL